MTDRTEITAALAWIKAKAEEMSKLTPEDFKRRQPRCEHGWMKIERDGKMAETTAADALKHPAVIIERAQTHQSRLDARVTAAPLQRIFPHG